MNHVSRRAFLALSILLILALFPFWGLAAPQTQAAAGAPSKPAIMELTQWLILGPAPVSWGEKDVLRDEKAALEYPHISLSGLRPSLGLNAVWRAGLKLNWQKSTLPELNSPENQVFYLAVYLQPTAWLQTQLTLTDEKSEISAAAFLDGETTPLTPKNGKKQASLELTREKHLLIIKLIAPKGKKIPLKIALETGETFKGETIALSHDPKTVMKIEHVLNAVAAGNVQISPDGRLAAVSLQKTARETGKTHRWIEILNVATGKTVLSSQSLGAWNNLQWLSDSFSFSFTTEDSDKTTLRRYDLNSHEQRVILEDIANFSQYLWSPDNSFLLYSIRHETKDDAGHRFIRKLTDRNKTLEDRSSWYIYFPREGGVGVQHKLSGEDVNYSGAVISPDNRRVLFTRSGEDYTRRPYSKTELFILDVQSLSAKKAAELYFMQNAEWTADSRKLIITGGPSLFGDVGNVLPKDVAPNEYDNQAYLFDPETGKAEALSRDFDPSLGDILHVSAKEAYFLAEDKTFSRLARLDLGSKTFRLLDASADVIRSISVSRNRAAAVYWASSATVPFKLYKMALPSGKGQVLRDYNREMFADVELGTIENWNYKSEKGRIVMGLIYLPPGFDRAKKYPVIVYYYGGTSPVDRSFSGRYPFNWYAAQGYVTYVPQPAGTTGFGQAFSAVHVNDWGVSTSNEIIGAVKELIKTHSYIDPERIGAMGASYGGFLTQYLATRNEIFSAYISHAGITSLASYWGVGDWGYSYSAFASADAFPWNRKDLYVGHSPLFMAERIQKPLLLLHGDADNNVPPGESYQMFAALKLLGKEAALITYKDQTHFINDYKKRIHWMRAIMAWWEKHLRKKPAEFDFMFPSQ